ncbi:hypothetical protein [Jiangella sp. DSM 45060]|uniref:hypothetical protein n=1 Tax=Jiangella sp. DSM 45060 TaxID=1798224 RepID=UPI00087D4EA3|nr:hypothetical protein [Jiangella sp. DSM 45060]SDT36869.1 hypothetical protein SAMN04515669_3746 [Jiangella sp. DSM 45060]
MTKHEPGSTGDAATSHIESATTALQLAAFEADVAYPHDRVLMLRRLLEMLGATQNLVGIVLDHAAIVELFADNQGTREDVHVIHLARLSQLLVEARIELMISCGAIITGPMDGETA